MNYKDKHMNEHLHAHVFTYKHLYIYTHTPVHVVHTHIPVHVHRYTHTHTCPCAHTYIHTLCILFPLLKSQAPYKHLKCPCFPLFLRAKLSEFITHFSIFAAAMPAHTRNIFCARNACSDEMSLLTYTLQCERKAIVSFFYSAWEFLGSYEKEWCNYAWESLLRVPCVCDPEGPALHWSTNILHTLLWPFSHWEISSSSFISRADL